ncbi:hypothetical protein ADL27_38440 [Streptomyces sp. NRRL F-6602]|nr:hypothetical protein ADL27_38440 [Streptomyces sp. NRRL F-6602]
MQDSLHHGVRAGLRSLGMDEQAFHRVVVAGSPPVRTVVPRLPPGDDDELHSGETGMVFP